METKIKFAELEHAGGQHGTFTESCYKCHRESELIKAHNLVNDPFSFDNMKKFIGEVNRINYGINPYENT